jgi:hypothetical protein
MTEPKRCTYPTRDKALEWRVTCGELATFSVYDSRGAWAGAYRCPVHAERVKRTNPTFTLTPLAAATQA